MSARYGCFDHAPYAETMDLKGVDVSPNGYPRAFITRIPFRMAMSCQFTLTDLGKEDPKCNGCKHKATND